MQYIYGNDVIIFMSLEYDLFVKIFKICFAHFLFFPTVVILRSYLRTRSRNDLFLGELEILAERKYLFLYLHFIDDMGNYNGYYNCF